MNAQFAAALLDPDLPPPAGLSAWNGSDTAARFAVYRNNVVASLIGALADTYPVTQELVGDAFFSAMARVYVSAQPPRTRVLAFYGASFPDFIAQFPPAASLTYLADVARLEMLRVQAYHAADCVTLGTEALAQMLTDTENLPGLKIVLHPSVGLLRTSCAVASLWAAHQGIVDLSEVDPLVPENAMVLRAGLEVEVMRLNPGAAEFIAQLLQSRSLGDAVQAANLTAAEFDLSEILGVLIRAEVITQINSKETSA